MAIDIVNLTGGTYGRGEAFGSIRRGQIQAWISDWLHNLEGTGIANPQDYIAEMLRESDFLSGIEKFVPDLLEEVRGIACGARLPFDLFLGAQLLDEEWAHRLRVRSNMKTPPKCSSLAVTSKHGQTWVGQNMDLESYVAGHELVLQIAGNALEPDVLVFTVGGMIGLMGVNSSGLALCVNSLPQLPAGRQGVPVAFVTRRILQARNVDEAVETVRAIPHATGQHYLMVDACSIRSLEASPAGVAEYRSSDSSRVFHTNHPLADELQKLSGALDQNNSIARLNSLKNRLATGDLDLATIMAALSSSDDADNPVCRVETRSTSAVGAAYFTAGSMISVLRTGAQAIESWVSAGPPSVCGYTQVNIHENG